MNTAGEPWGVSTKKNIAPGDVVITKDSETPEDIGVPAVVIEKLQGVVCGYHLAIIRSDKEKVDPIYLAKAIQTTRVKKQFYKLANGATRYGLAVGDIGKIEFIAPNLELQGKIARMFQDLDREHALLVAIRGFRSTQKKGLMQKLLTGRIRVKE